MEKRVSPSGVVEAKIQPSGLPAIWVELRLCDRCKPYQECLGFKDISDTAWQEVNNVISSACGRVRSKTKECHVACHHTPELSNKIKWVSERK